MMSNHQVPAAAEGMPDTKPSSPRSTGIDATFWNATAVVALAAGMLIENFETDEGGENCVLPVFLYEQITSLLVLTRDACEAHIREART